jgi:hypothetical protein
MSEILNAYIFMSSSSPRKEVFSVLQSIIDASPFSVDQDTREKLIQVLLDDLVICGDNKGRLTRQDASQALLAVKTLGKHPLGSEVLASSANLSILLALSTSLKGDKETSSEALRCVANALLLVEEARNNWVTIDVGGGQASVELLEASTTPDQIFLASRLLFLCTVSAASSGYIRILVEGKHHGGSIIDIIAAKLDTLIISICSGTTMSREAMTDLLKFTFNLLVHYPKMTEDKVQEVSGDEENRVMGDCWNHRLDGILSPLLRLFYSLPPTFPGPLAPPLTHVIHSLISIPITSSLRSMWLGLPPLSPRSPRSSAPGSPVYSRTGSPTLTPQTKPGPMEKARSVLAAGRRSLSRSPSPLPLAPTLDVLLRAHDLLDVSLSHYFPGDVDPDDPSVREICKAEGDNSLDDILTPLVVLITRLCIFDEGSKMRMRQWVIPPDLDRTRPLESRPGLLGRCLRVLGSVYHPRMKDAAGEMLFAICDSDAATLATQVGYGNVAGFLFNKGIMNAPSSSNASLVIPSGHTINPITGTFEEKAPLPEMTDEEKEMEAEKLFVLFDRLEKTGSLHPSQNPIRRAVQEGKLG